MSNSNVAMAEVLEIPKRRGDYGKGSITQRGDRFQISFYDTEGRRRRESFGTRSKAEKALNQKVTLRDTGKLDEAESRITVDGLAELYITKCRGTAPKSIDWIELVWRVHLEPFFGGFRASRINTEKILQYRAERLEAGAGAWNGEQGIDRFPSNVLSRIRGLYPAEGLPRSEVPREIAGARTA